MEAHSSKIGEPLGVLAEARDSLIPGAGLGLFALKDLKKNQVVTWYAGRAIDRAEAAALADPSFLLSAEFDIVIDGIRVPVEGEGGASFTNHSSGAAKNVKFVTIFDKTIHANRIVIKCLRDIAKGEELLVNYGRHYWIRMEQTPR